MKIQLDTLAYMNRLRHISPAQKLWFGFGLLCFVLLAHTSVHVTVLVWMSVWIIGYAGISARAYAGMMGAVALFLLFGLPPLVLEISSFPPGEPMLFQFSIVSWHVYASEEGVKAAGVLLFRSLASVSCLYFILLTVPFTEMLAILRRIGIPSLVTDLLLVMYRFIFVFLETVEQLWIAQQARGGGHGFKWKMRNAGWLVTRLFTRTMQRYQQLSIGLTARGFDGELRVISVGTFSISKRYAFESVIGFIGLVLLEWWMRR
ncbi:cobalt ECF transporter T component CbiQ [Aneurinibacillus danicus]|uniref:Cobalt ECF transporter T component CbiQ n=1 Tax=Aneurinibacillus danicus TaxID=267746 RepID=A0A511VAG6_9BACL|nr:cobalt ECF transporter T component CbiQ [Aneurinibacillus danicus]GEN34222.1 cobalt ECF transporter T component CbiQ [Aneurinibacillus danicus]